MTVTQDVAPRGPTTALAQDHASLIVHGQDRTGIVATVGSVLTRHGANIVSLDQYSDNPQGGAFFQRTVFTLDYLKAVLPGIRKDLGAALAKGFRPGVPAPRHVGAETRRDLRLRNPITACSTCCGGTGAVNCRSTWPW